MTTGRWIFAALYAAYLAFYIVPLIRGVLAHRLPGESR